MHVYDKINENPHKHNIYLRKIIKESTILVILPIAAWKTCSSTLSPPLWYKHWLCRRHFLKFSAWIHESSCTMAQTHTHTYITERKKKTNTFVHPTLSICLCIHNTGWHEFGWWEYCRFSPHSQFDIQQQQQYTDTHTQTPLLYPTYKQGLWQCIWRIWLSSASFPIGFPYRSQFGVVNMYEVVYKWTMDGSEGTNTITHIHQ